MLLRSKFPSLILLGLVLVAFQNCGDVGSVQTKGQSSVDDGGGDDHPSGGGLQGEVPSPPVAPSQLSARAIDATQIALSWLDNSANETGFKLERALSPSGPFVGISIARNMTSYTDSGLSPMTAYYYRIAAVNAVGASGETSVVSISTSAGPMTPPGGPAAPTYLLAIPGSSTTINLEWKDNSSNEQSFRIERAVFSAMPIYMEIATIPANIIVYSDSKLTPSTSYIYRVRAVNADGASPYADTSVTTLNKPLASFSFISNNIFQGQCTGCHRNISTYAGALQMLVKGNSAQSKLYQRLLKKEMPPTGLPVPDEQVLAVKQWIDNGALNN